MVGLELGVAKIFGAITSVVALFGGGKWFWSWKNSKDKQIEDVKKTVDKINENQIKITSTFLRDENLQEIRDTLKLLTETQIDHSNKFQTEEDVREEIERSTHHIRESINNIEKISKSTQEAVLELTIQLREKTAVDKALEDYRRQKEV